MRNYKIDSPEAAARIVSTVALSDGHLCKREPDRMHELGATVSLGLSREIDTARARWLPAAAVA